MADGTGRLRDINRQDMEVFRNYVRASWFKIAINSQLSERWVKDSNECTATSKDDKMSNIYEIIK